MPRKAKAPKTVLVVGDWVVDEHWVLGVNRSPTGSRKGRQHRRSLHSPTGAVESLCGAGRTASVLFAAQPRSIAAQGTGGPKSFDVYGLGLWHPRDTEILTSMLDSGRHAGETPFKLTRVALPLPGTSSGHLVNLADLLRDGSSAPDWPAAFRYDDAHFGTTHVIRIYRDTGKRVELDERIDWELTVHGHQDYWIHDGSASVLGDPKGDSTGLPRNVDAVVLKDLCKGVVSPDLVSWLVRRYADARWFVSSKAWRPGWIAQLAGARVEVFVVPEVAAAGAVRAGEVHSWTLPNGRPTREAHQALAGLASSLQSGGKRPRTLVLPHGMQILAMDEAGAVSSGWLHTNTEVGAPAPGMPMASVFFGAVVADGIEGRSTDLRTVLHHALDFTAEWRSLEVQRLSRPDDWDGHELSLQLPWMPEDPQRIRLRPYDWATEGTQWDEGYRPKSCGVVMINGRGRLQLWRAKTEVSGYVCCAPDKRREILKLVNIVRKFKDDHERRSASCLLSSRPGSGKSLLVQSVASQIGVRMLPFNITQLVGRADLLDCFDTIVTSQAQNRGEPHLVFVDEVNAPLDGHSVYDAFLAPLEDGVYVRAGRRFHIEPCIWVFAGTESLVDGQRRIQQVGDKRSDFFSRLTHGAIDLLGSTSDHDMNSLENVYLGATLIRRTFPEIKAISPKVLRAFAALPTDRIDARQMRHFVEAFQVFREPRITSKSVPAEWLQQVLGEAWNALWDPNVGEPPTEDVLIEDAAGEL